MKNRTNLTQQAITPDQLVTVEVDLEQGISNVVEATFTVVVPFKDATNRDALLKACDEQECDQDGYASSWRYQYRLQDLAIDIEDAEVVASKITGTVEEDED